MLHNKSKMKLNKERNAFNARDGSSASISPSKGSSWKQKKKTPQRCFGVFTLACSLYFTVFSCSSTRNEEEEDRIEKVERGTKVKRTLSSLRNRMTGSFNKDKVIP